MIGGKFIATFFTLLMVAFGCYHPKKVELDIKSNEEEVKLNHGDTLAITLEGNPTTGYTWEVSEIDEQILKQVGEIEFKPESDLLGAPGVQIIRFEVVGKGNTPLKLIYHRPWEEGVKPLKTFSIQVVAR